MFYDERTDGSHTSIDALWSEYEEDLRAAIEAVGIDGAAEETGIDRERLVALLEGPLQGVDLSLSEAAAIQSIAQETPDADEIVDLACDHLLLGMSTAILDVDGLDRHLDLDLGPKTIQRKIERREPMTFDEFVRFQHVIEREQA
ncbi:MAG: DUF5791 family protein [Halanaeroarchaeum sp.]